MSTKYEDQIVVCADCQREFVWTAGEQEFFHEKGFTTLPKRCKDCRQAKRVQRGDQLGGGRK